MKIIKILLLFSAISTFSYAQHWKGVGGGMDDGIICFYNDTIRHLLYAGGAFHYAGGVLVEKIAKWDGVSWTEMSGVNQTVISITADSNFVYCANGNYALKYTGSNWLSLPVFNAQVKAVGVVNGELYAGGDFSYQGSNPISCIAKWNGTSWDSLGAGVGEPFHPSYVDAITEYQGKVAVGGMFILAGGDTANSIALWNGSTWEYLGSGMGGPSFYGFDVYDLFADGNDLYVGGRFQTAGGVTVNGIAMWDGTSWHSFGNGAMLNGNPSAVNKVLLYNNQLYASGGFDSNRLAKWDGSNWDSYFDEELYGLGDCMAFYNNEFYVGGIEATDTNGQVLNHIARTATFEIANDTVVCSSSCNGTATAAVLGVLPDTYLWSDGETTQIATHLCPGNNAVTVTDASGSPSIGSVTIIGPPAIIFIDTILDASCATCNDGSAIISFSGGAGDLDILWNTGDTSNSIINQLPGTYYFTIKDSIGCMLFDTVVIGVYNGISQFAFSDNQLTVFPNPVTSIVTLQYQTTNAGKSTVTVENCLRQVMLTQNLTIKNQKGTATIDMSSYASGMYFIKCFDGKQQTVVKVVKE